MISPLVTPHTIAKGTCHMVMAHGTVVNFDDISSTRVSLSEIYVHIRNINRYCGAIDVKLLHHLYLTGYLLRKQFAATPPIPDSSPLTDVEVQVAYAYTHDFPEAYIGDVVTGLKYLPFFKGYRALEHEFDKHIHNKLGLPITFRADGLIKAADRAALVYEMTAKNHPSAGANSSFYNIPVDPLILQKTEEILATAPSELWLDMLIQIYKIKDQLRSLNGDREDHGGSGD